MKVWPPPCKFSHRYLPDRQLPDKAVSVLDTACARLSLGQNTIPAALEDATREIDDCTVQTRVLERESSFGADHTERLENITKRKVAAEARLADLQARWEKERDLVARIRDVRAKLEGVAQPMQAQAQAATAAAPTSETQAAPLPADPAALRAELATLNAELDTAPGRNAAHARLRRRADRRRSDLRLDRHSRRQDAEGRNRNRARRSKRTSAAASSGRITHWT